MLFTIFLIVSLCLSVQFHIIFKLTTYTPFYALFLNFRVFIGNTSSSFLVVCASVCGKGEYFLVQYVIFRQQIIMILKFNILFTILEETHRKIFNLQLSRHIHIATDINPALRYLS